MRAKYFSAGSILMAIFIFIITGVFSWFGSNTLLNHDKTIKAVSAIEKLSNNISTLNKNIEKLNEKIDKNKIQVVKNTVMIENLRRYIEKR